MKDLHAQWPHRWLNPKAASGPSPIQGTGVFANQTIQAGETVGVLGGIIIHRDDIKRYWQWMTHVGIQIDDNFFIVPATRSELEQHGVFNHSCDPNAGFSSSITLMAIRDIAVGEEIVFDYAFCETIQKGFDCRCGAPSCRKQFTPEDWKDKAIQKKYQNFFSPFLRKKIT